MGVRQTLLVSMFCLVAWGSLPPGRAHAAEAYDNCTGYIPSVPAVIGSQGTWCMTSDLSTSLTSTFAIAVGANNVTIDCNGFKLGNLTAGPGTNSTGISAIGRANTTIRNCNIRGFRIGAELESVVGGYVVEDNRFDGNTSIGLSVSGDGSRIRRNQIVHTGGATSPFSYAAGLLAEGTMDISNNQISDVSIGVGNLSAGILLSNATGGRIADNSISDIVTLPPGTTVGIQVYEGLGVVIRDNEVTGRDLLASSGILCFDASEGNGTVMVRGNSIVRYQYGLSGCDGAPGNVVDNFVPF